MAPGAELEAAARAGLEPWGVVVVILPGPSPGATAPDSNEAARALALSAGVNAVVWVSEHDGQYALWVYDLETHHVIERALAKGPPFDGATAAAVALSVKTLLRHSAAAPPDQRYGASGGAAPTAEPDAPPPAHVPPQRDEPMPAGSLLELAAAGGVQLLATQPHALEARLRLAASWWPERGSIGVELGAVVGPSLAVHDARLDGRLIDVGARVVLALRHDVTRRMRTSAFVGGTLHVLALDGSLPVEDQSTSDLRLSPSLLFALQGDWALSARVRVGVWGELGYLLRAERYLVGHDQVLALRHVRAATGLALSVAVIE